MGTLYVVGTPIGNLQDVTLRAIRVLREVAVIAAEDTRVTGTLLAAHDIRTPLVSFHEFSGDAKVRRLVERLAGEDVALVSDAGMPGLSDPGFPLIRAALDADVPVVPIPGPSAILAALVASGLPMHAFSFYGFLPRKVGERRRLLERLGQADHTTVVFESPHRVAAALRDVAQALGPERPVAACRELTKKFEEIVRGGAADVAERVASGTVRGEFTLVIGPAAKVPAGRRGGSATDEEPGRARNGSRRTTVAEAKGEDPTAVEGEKVGEETAAAGGEESVDGAGKGRRAKPKSARAERSRHPSVTDLPIPDPDPWAPIDER